ncbi:hypothetical protein ACFQUU_09860 [Herbaspirillum sp. GCM10030257]|uniref:hypothetical protein n=1 Tax=Herbaspirillum sp. GCM10030257 TaxID=3273393 RepID=UPI0036176A95
MRTPLCFLATALMLTACSSVDPKLLSIQNKPVPREPTTTPAASAAPDAAKAPAATGSSSTPTRPADPRSARRVVPATIVRMPEPPVPAPSPAPPILAVPQAVGPPPPAPVTSCDSGGCWSGGERYQGSGGTYVAPGGQTCRSNGAFMQCF